VRFQYFPGILAIVLDFSNTLQPKIGLDEERSKKMIALNLDDVYAVLELVAPYLIGFAVVVVAAIVAMVACKKLHPAKKYLIHSNATLAIVLALIIMVNLICNGPMFTLVSLATGFGTVSDENTAEAIELGEQIAAEGIVVLENKDNILPLTGTTAINAFGWAASNPIYGGTGSGSLNDLYEKVDFVQGMENAGIKVNAELIDFYAQYNSTRPQRGWDLPEPPVGQYSDSLIENAKAFSDTAIIMLARNGGEGDDIPVDVSQVAYTDNSSEYKDFEPGEHYLQPSRTEQDMIDLVCANFDKVILIYNGANAIELAWTRNYEQIKGVIWCPGPGQTGFNSLGKIISGAINPSAKLADTFVVDLTDTPTWNNFGHFRFANMVDDYTTANSMFSVSGSPSFVNYVEGIYVGYRFYETAAYEGLINYDDVVLYPFGYGLSYTTFEQTMGAISENNGTISFDVTVTNTGSVAGKNVVQVYYNPPYTNGGIEKSTANLIAFSKTDVLEPNASQTITISFAVEDMASYDVSNGGRYVLEGGDYTISINSDSHNIIDSKTHHVASTIIYDENNTRSTDLVTATNQFENAAGDVTYLSRADHFANYGEATAKPKDINLAQKYVDQFIWTDNYDPTKDDERNYPNAEMPVTGENNGVKLADLRGLDYDDPMWDKLLNEMSVDDMNTLISLSGHSTPAINSIGKVQTIDENGPASINNTFTDAGSVGFPCPVVIACTWNENLALEFGRSIGKMADDLNTTGWYAPAMNIHRSAFSGRNFEYYSEDPIISAVMGNASVVGAWEHGVYAYIKHFAMNDQETNRMFMICTWSNEQAIREIYLKAFEKSVKVGKAKAVMAAYDYIGTTWCGGNSALLENVLRDEWGFDGFVLTDYNAMPYFMNMDQAVRNGTDACLITYEVGANNVNQRTPAGVQAMRSACHDLLYVVVNSRAYAPENLNMGMPTWQKIEIAIDVVLVAALIAIEVFIIRKGYLKRKNAQVPEN